MGGAWGKGTGLSLQWPYFLFSTRFSSIQPVLHVKTTVQWTNVLLCVALRRTYPNIGLVMITALTRVAERLGCYKVILDCSEQNQPFYERCGMARKEVQMARYLLDP